MTPSSDIYRWALQYLGLGLPIFPCGLDSKQPAIARSQGGHGLYDATTDAAQIDAWFSPGLYNIAACPDDYGCFVVDCDGTAGVTSWMSFELAYNVKDRCGLVVETRSGGRHYWFKGQLHSSARKIAPGIDIRGIGGYVLLPGSSVGGRDYKVISGSFGTIRPAPEALFEYFVQANERGEYVQRIVDENFVAGSSTAHAWCDWWVGRCIAEGKMPEKGTRNAWATAFYIQLYTHGCSEEYARELHERIYEAGGVRPDDGDTKLEDLIRRVFDGKMKCNPAGSELPSAISVFGDPTNILASLNAPIGLLWGDQIVKRKIDWLWKGWLAKGKIHLIAGEPGCGKSTLALKLLAAVSRGDQWPDLTVAPRGRVLVWSTEDNIEDTLLPRFEACGGDPRMFAAIGRVEDEMGEPGDKRMFDPARDMGKLIATARQIPDLRAIIIDPISVIVTGDSHKNSEVRRGLMPLYDFAEQTGVAVIGITHFTKGTAGKDPASRVTGSLGFGAVARVVLAAAKDENGAHRRLVRAKSNIGPDGGGFDFTLERDDDDAQFVTFGAYHDGVARELLGELEPDRKMGRPEDVQGKQECRIRLRELILEHMGPRGALCATVNKRLEVEGYTAGQVRAAVRADPGITTEVGPGFREGSLYYKLS